MRSAPGSPSAGTSSAPSPAVRVGSAGSTPFPCATRSPSTASAASCSTSSTSCRASRRIRLCIAYEIDGRRVETWPSSGAALSRATPVYETFDRLGGADQRRPVAGRPARERPPLRLGDRGARRRADRPRVGRARADPDDRARLAPDAQPPGPAGMSLITPTRILVVGGGGREHALAWKLAAEPGVNEVVVAPGSDAIAAEPRVRCLPGVDPLDPAAVVAAARREAVELVVIGPEAPLAAGVRRRAARRRVRGVRADASRRPDRVEQGVLPRGGARRPACRWPGRRRSATRPRPRPSRPTLPRRARGVVVKADGLAAGKGVTVCDTAAEAAAAIDALREASAGRRGRRHRPVGRHRGAPDGREASLIALCDGR